MTHARLFIGWLLFKMVELTDPDIQVEPWKEVKARAEAAQEKEEG